MGAPIALPPFPKLGSSPYTSLGEWPPNAIKNWEQACIHHINRSLGKNATTFKEANDAFEAHIKGLSTPKAKIDFAKDIRDKVRKTFYRNEVKSPTFSYTETQLTKMKANGSAPDPTFQLEHLSEIQDYPERAIHPDNIYITKGGTGGTAPASTPHGAKTAGARVARATPTVTTPPTSATGTGTAARATTSASTGVSASSRAVTKAPTLPKRILTKLDSFFKHVGREAIKALPSIFKMISIAGIGMSIISLAEALVIIKNIFDKGTAIPQVDAELAGFISAINNSNTQVNKIYESNILEIDIMSLADELMDIGDKETLDKIGDRLLDDKKYMEDFKEDLSTAYDSLDKIQKNLEQNSKNYYAAYTSLLTIESASKATALLLWDAYRAKANSLSGLVTSTKDSIDTLKSLIDDFDGMFDYVNEQSTVIQILRNRDVAGVQIYPDGVKPLKSEWGPDVTPE